MRRSVDGSVSILTDERSLSLEELLSRPHARTMDLTALLPRLKSPDADLPLTLDLDAGALTDGQQSYPLRGGLPLLMPRRLQPYFVRRLEVPVAAANDSFLQYFLLASIKQSGEINAAPSDVHFRRHLARMHEFVAGCGGLVLDVGCDDPALSAALFPPAASYVGLDPFCLRDEPFRLIGVGEFLPFQDSTIDNVVFNTSLDHILDWRRAVNEAHRVLVAGGALYVCTLIWEHAADLLADAVHFHHFRLGELLSGLEGFDVEAIRAYDYKANTHRYGLYLLARKRDAAPDRVA